MFKLDFDNMFNWLKRRPKAAPDTVAAPEPADTTTSADWLQIK